MISTLKIIIPSFFTAIPLLPADSFAYESACFSEARASDVVFNYNIRSIAPLRTLASIQQKYTLPSAGILRTLTSFETEAGNSPGKPGIRVEKKTAGLYGVQSFRVFQGLSYRVAIRNQIDFGSDHFQLFTQVFFQIYCHAALIDRRCDCIGNCLGIV